MEHTQWRPSFFNSISNFFEKPPLCTSLERHFSDIGHEHATVSELEEALRPAPLQTVYTLHCSNFWTQVQKSYKQHLNSLKCPKPLLRAFQVCCREQDSCTLLPQPATAIWGGQDDCEQNPLTTLQRATWESELLRNYHDRGSTASSLLKSSSCGPAAHSLWQPAELGTLRKEYRRKILSSRVIDSTRDMSVVQVFLPSHGKTKTGWKFWGCTIHRRQRSNEGSYSFSVINLANTWTLSHYLGGKKPPSIQWMPFYFQCFFFHTRLSFIPQLSHQGQFCLKFCN